ncbi:RE1-silencing transcription factor isoform X3 [Orussus abietinus]|uniref:RE1-silencing transcription factor isoform X3 n=1 Tax=Orussus abietinus TaxID=222816 RepID=UPI000626E8D3|nr:RE1-silencing transcription factor isoform X3 [Orussus abietinus]
MENRPAPLRSRRVCRFCLTESEPLSFIYERDHSKPFQVPLTLQIMSCVAIEVYAADGMPQMICSTCRWNLDRSYKFKLQCKKADEALRAYPLSGVLPRPFPPIPNDPPETGTKRSSEQRIQNDQLKKARVDSGERRENRERTIEKREKGECHDLYEEEQDGGSDGENEANNDKEDRKLEPGEIRVHACDQCERTFPLRQALQLHVQRAHRDRDYKCTECDRMFFTKYDLAKHVTTHTEEKPFSCAICHKKFSRSSMLQRHEKLHRDELRHMRSHSVEKRHICEDCGKAFKRKESLEVHQLTHTKRTGMGLNCDVCQESCRNRADYVTHIKQHIEAGEKMGPDGLPPDAGKDKIDSDSEEEEEEEQYSDGDDDYEPPSYVAKKYPKSKHSESDDDVDRSEKEDRKEQIVFVRNKDGNVVKKTIKTLMPIQRRDMQENKAKSGPSNQSNSKVSQSKPSEASPKGRIDETEAEVQKIVASVFEKHKIPLKHQNIPQDQGKEAANPPSQGHSRSQTLQSGHSANILPKEEKPEISGQNTPKAVNTVKVIKRFVVRKPGGTETPTSTPNAKESETTPSGTSQNFSGSGPKVTKRVIVRRIIRQGDTTREVIMNPDGTIIDPAELAKLPTGNVVKRVVVKKPIDKTQALVQTMLQSPVDQRQTTTLKTTDPLLGESPKFELKTSQSSTTPGTMKMAPTTSGQKPEQKQGTSANLTKGDQETKEKLEQLEKRVEQQRLKIEELQARKQQEYEPVDEMLPERHDESEDEQQLPLKRVFVKRKQSIYDEEQEYNDSSDKVSEKEKEMPGEKEIVVKALKESTDSGEIPTPKKDYKPPQVTSSKVYGNKKIIVVKTEEASEVDEMSRELSSILDSTENVVKMQDNVLSNLCEISGIGQAEPKTLGEPEKEETLTPMEAMKHDANENDAENQDANDFLKTDEMDIQQCEEAQEHSEEDQTQIVVEENAVSHDSQDDSALSLGGQDLTEAADIFEPSDTALDDQKQEVNLEDSVIELSEGNDTINLNDTNDSHDSLEDKLSRMEG